MSVRLLKSEGVKIAPVLKNAASASRLTSALVFAPPRDKLIHGDETSYLQ